MSKCSCFSQNASYHQVDASHYAHKAVAFDAGDAQELLAQLAATPGYIRERNSASATFEEAKIFVISALDSIPEVNFFKWGVPEKALHTLKQGIVSLPYDEEMWKKYAKRFPFAPFVASIEGPVIAPLSHKLVFESPKASVIDWQLASHYREPFHTHMEASVMFLLSPAARTYYNAEGIASSKPRPPPDTPIVIAAMGPEWMHSIANDDDITYHVIRIFFKPAFTVDYHWP